MAGNGHMYITLIGVPSANPTTCPLFPFFFVCFTCVPPLPLLCVCVVSSCHILFLFVPAHSPGEMCEHKHEVGLVQAGNAAITNSEVKW